MNYSFEDLTPTGLPFEGTYIPHNQSSAFVYATNGTSHLLFKLMWTAHSKKIDLYKVSVPVTVAGATIQKRINIGTYPFNHTWTWYSKPGSFAPDPSYIVEGKFRIQAQGPDAFHTFAIGF